VWVHWTSRSYLHTVPTYRTDTVLYRTHPVPVPYSYSKVLTYIPYPHPKEPPTVSLRNAQTDSTAFISLRIWAKKKGRYYYILSYMFLCMCHILGNRFPGRSGWPSVSTLPLSNLVLSSLGVNVGTQLKQNYLTKK